MVTTESKQEKSNAQTETATEVEESTLDLSATSLDLEGSPGVLRAPTKQELNETFEMLCNSQYKGVEGVLKIDSGVPGPTFGVTVMTHGNEPAGVAAVWAGLQEGGMFTKLTKGSVIVAISNIDAATEYFAEPEDATAAQLNSHRSIEVNMNRLPKDLREGSYESKEVQRAQALLPILEEFEVGLDIHSTDVESTPMLVEETPTPNALLKHIPAKVILTNASNVIKDSVLYAYYGTGQDTTKLLIEAGSHESSEALVNAIDATEGILSSLDMLPPEEAPQTSGPQLYHRYKVVDSVFWEKGDENMLLAKKFQHLEEISKGQLLAEDATTGKQIFSPIDGHILFPFATGRPNNMGEEGAFISERVKKIIL